MEQGIGTGGMHIATPPGLVQWVGYLMGPRKNSLILTSSTQLPKFLI